MTVYSIGIGTYWREIKTEKCNMLMWHVDPVLGNDIDKQIKAAVAW
jgi:hypothetical protein